MEAPRKQKIKIAIVERTHSVKENARDTAEARLTENADQLKGFKGFLKKLWQHNYAYDYYRQKEITKAQKEIHELERLRETVADGPEREAVESSIRAVVKQFTSEYAQYAVHKDAGEKRAVLEDTPAEKEIKKKILEMVQEYALKDMRDPQVREAFAIERKAIIESVAAAKGEVLDEKAGERNRLFADNLEEVVWQVQAQVAHGTGAELLDLEFEVVAGRARSNVRTDQELKRVDGLVDRIQSSKVGKFLLVNEATVAAGLGMAASVGVFGAKALTSRGAAWASLGLTALVAGGIAAVRESRRMEKDRSLHSREMAMGKKIEPGQKRREEMEKTRYETKSAGELAQRLETSLVIIARNQPPGMTLEQRYVLFKDGFLALAEVDDLVQKGNEEKKDYIHFSNPQNIVKERCELDVLRAQLRAAIHGTLSTDSELHSYVTSSTVNAELVAQRALVRGERETERERKDALFSQIKDRKVFKAATVGALVGLGVGLVAQETMAFFNKNQMGLIERLTQGKPVNPPDSVTALEWVRMKASHLINGEPSYMLMGGPVMDQIGSNHIRMPDGFSLTKVADTVTLIRNGEVVVSGLTTDRDGNFTDAAKDLLKKHDIALTGGPHTAINYIDTTVTEPGKRVAVRTPMSVGEAVQDYAERGDTKTIKRELWYDNNTPKPVFDKNELRLWYGGPNNTGVNAAGDYVYTVRGMRPDGSFHGPHSANAQELMRTGKLSLLLSVSKGTQNQVFEVAIDRNGQAIIPRDSEVARLLFETDAKGRAVFKGAFAEVAQTMRVREDATGVRILATQVGEDRPSVPDKVTYRTEDAITRRVTREETIRWWDTTINVPADPEVDPPPFIPFIPRTPLERLRNPDPLRTPVHGPSPEEPGHFAGGYGYERGSGGMKNDYTDLEKVYRNTQNSQRMKELVERLKYEKDLRVKYRSVLNRLKELEDFENLPARAQQVFEGERLQHNKRYNTDYSLSRFVDMQLDRTYRQIENIFIEESKVGGKPFAEEFYKTSPLRKGLERADEVILMLDGPVGDSVVTMPVIMALDHYFKQNGTTKQITVVSQHNKALFGALETQYPGLRVVNLAEVKALVQGAPNRERFVINADKTYKDYAALGVAPRRAGDPGYVMSVDWNSWLMEEAPREGKLTKRYDMIPQRVMRNLELMTGQKLFEDIKKVESFIGKRADHTEQVERLRTKYDIQPNEKVITISAGAGVQPKEYAPERWEELLTKIFAEHADAHVLFLEDPSAERRGRYASLMERLKTRFGRRFSVGKENAEFINPILAMSKVVVTPDTGLGHFAAALGTPNVMLILGDPIQWSEPKTIRVTHAKAFENYRKRTGTYALLWDQKWKSGYYIEENGEKIGASSIPPERIYKRINQVLSKP